MDIFRTRFEAVETKDAITPASPSYFAKKITLSCFYKRTKYVCSLRSEGMNEILQQREKYRMWRTLVEHDSIYIATPTVTWQGLLNVRAFPSS